MIEIGNPVRVKNASSDHGVVKDSKLAFLALQELSIQQTNLPQLIIAPLAQPVIQVHLVQLSVSSVALELFQQFEVVTASLAPQALRATPPPNPMGVLSARVASTNPSPVN